MCLQSGTYTITSILGNLTIGIDPNEQHGPQVKRILTVPNLHREDPTGHWNIVKEDDGEDVYELGLLDAFATKLGDHAFAVPKEFPEGKEWKVQRQGQHGPDIYTITYRGSGFELGWFSVGGQPFIQLEVRPLIKTPSIPPHYMPEALFKIIPLHH